MGEIAKDHGHYLLYMIFNSAWDLGNRGFEPVVAADWLQNRMEFQSVKDGMYLRPPQILELYETHSPVPDYKGDDWSRRLSEQELSNESRGDVQGEARTIFTVEVYRKEEHELVLALLDILRSRLPEDRQLQKIVRASLEGRELIPMKGLFGINQESEDAE